MATPVLVETGTPHRLLGAVAIAAITFSNVCGSPLGIEGAVGAGGAFGCVMMLLAGLAVWAVPQALIVAELSTTFPGDHGGSVRWVEAGLGELAGFVNAAVTQLNSISNVSVYPVLVSDTLGALLPGVDGPIPATCVRVGVIVIAVLVNAAGERAVALSTEWLVAAILLAYLSFPIAILAVGAPMDASALGPSGVPSSLSLFTLFNGVLWNLGGWAQVGTLAASTKDPARNYPLGILAAMVAVGAGYAWPVLWGYAAVPQSDAWESGSFPAIAAAISPAFGKVILVASTASGVSQCIASIACYSRQLQAVAASGILPLPSILGRDFGPQAAPLVAILALVCLALPLTLLDSDVLIGFDNGFGIITVAFFALAFLRLRYTQAGLARPYTVPGGAIGAWAAGLCIMTVVVFALYSAADGAPVYTLPVLMCAPVALLLLAAALQRWRRRRGDGGNWQRVPVHANTVEMPVKAVTDGAALAPRQPAWTVGEEQGGRADERSPLLMPVPAPLLTPSTSGLPVSALAT